MADTSTRSSKRTAFTLVELLIVLAIIAVLAALLVPALGRARVLARRVKCMANQRSLAQGVQTFAAEHKGFGQLIAEPPMVGEPRTYRYLPDRYDYEKEGHRGSTARPTLSSWPIAYADYIGAPGLRGEDFYLGAWEPEPGLSVLQAVQKNVHAKRKVGVLRCPADRDLIGGVPGVSFGGRANVAAISYSINGDLFRQGLADSVLDSFGHPSNHLNGRPLPVWRKGRPSGSALGGRLDRVVDPACSCSLMAAESNLGFPVPSHESGG